MAMYIPSEYSKYVKNCKHLINISRDTFIAIDEINHIVVLRKEITERTKHSLGKIQSIKEIHEKPVCIVVLGHSNIGRAVVVNELFGGKRLLPTDKNHFLLGDNSLSITSHERDSINSTHWKAVKIRHSTYSLLSTSSHSNNSLSISPSTSSYISPSELQVHCEAVRDLQAVLVERSMLDIDLKHIILRDGMQIWVAPSFHYTDNRYSGNWCCTSPLDFFQLVEHCTSPIYIYALHGSQLSNEEKKQLKLFKEIMTPNSVIHFIACSSITPSHQVTLPPRRSSSRHRRHTSIHPSMEDVSISPSSGYNPNAQHYIPQSLKDLGEQLKDLGLLSHLSMEGDPDKVEVHSILSEMASGLPAMLPYVRSLLQYRLVRAATSLHHCHEQVLRFFILSAFDWARQIQVTPLRLEYVRRREAELYSKLVAVANRKQEEIRLLISATLKDSREQLLEAAANYQFSDIDTDTVNESVFVQRFSEEIKNGTLALLNELIAERLTRCVLDLREAYVGTLERCLESLEKSIQESQPSDGEPISSSDDVQASAALKRIINAAYQIDLSVKTSSSFVQSLWDRLQQFFKNMSTTRSLKEVSDLSTERVVNSPTWKRQIAANLVDTLNENRLARVICYQFRDRLRQSHEAFSRSIRQLESLHTGRLEKNEELYYKVRKVHAPRVARLALEAISLRDMTIYGMPQLGRELGRGQYGVVYGCDAWGPDSSKGRKCAVKSVVPPDEKHWNDLAMEFHYSRMVPAHDRIVSLKGSVIDYSYGGGCSPAVLLIMERLTRDLHAALKAGLTWPKRLRVAIDVVEGIRFLHSQGLVHRDIKLKNVLLDSEDRAKITDLGFCKPEAMMSGSIVGTPIHMAPELFTGHYDSSVDVYAFGILFWYICSGHTKLPYAFEQCHNKDQLWQNVRRGVRPERLQCFDDSCWSLMEDCWAGEASHRPLLGNVQTRLEAIFMSHCHGRTIDTGSIVVQYEKEPDSISSSPYVRVELEPTEPC